MKELEFLLAKHRKYLENLKILNTFKYSGLVGILIAGISRGVISPELNVKNILFIIFISFIIYVMFDNKIMDTETDLTNIEIKIRDIP